MTRLGVIPAFFALLSLIPLATAQSGAWGQCGGIGWTGPTTCIAGYTCTFSNAYYSQCLPGSTTTSSSGGSTTTTSSSVSTATAHLNAAAKAAGKKYFGSATDNPELTDKPYVTLLGDNTMFGQITPGNSMKWDATEPSQGNFTFAAGDVIANLAKSNGQLLRGHNCVWHNQLPSWVSSGSFTNASLLSVVTTHCSTVVSHYKGQVYSWDVINEPFNDDGTYRTDVFYTVTGTSYIAAALRAARAADPAAKLYINDYNLEYSSAKFTAMLTLVKSLLSQGVPLDGVGFQGHLIVGSFPTQWASNMAQITALGLEVAITELDIRMTLPATAALLQQQKQDYQSAISACKTVAGCVGVTIWDYTDKYSWVPSTFSGQGEACPWDANLVRKPAYDGIVNGFA